MTIELVVLSVEEEGEITAWLVSVIDVLMLHLPSI